MSLSLTHLLTLEWKSTFLKNKLRNPTLHLHSHLHLKLLERRTKRASSFKNPIPHSSLEDFINLKSFLLCNMHSSPILREALHRMKEIEPRILPSSHSSIEETSFLPEDSKETTETYPARVNPPNFATPRKVQIKTPSSPQPSSSTHRKKKKTQLAVITSTLIASSLASCAECHSVLRPKRRTSKAPPTQEVFPPLKRSTSSSLGMHSSFSSSS